MTSACYCHVVENSDSISDDDGVDGSLFEGCNDAGFLADGRHSPLHNTTDDVGNAQLPSPFSSPVYSPLTPPKKVHNAIFNTYFPLFTRSYVFKSFAYITCTVVT